MFGGVSRRTVLRLMGGAAVAGGLLAAGPAAASASRNWKPAAESVRREYLWAWQHYVDRALGADHIKPISGGREDFFVQGHSIGLSLVEAVDTLWLMEADAEVALAVRWIEDNLSFDVDAPFQVFETNIRMVGGLAAAYHCTGAPRLLELAVDVADRLLPAFTESPTGLPYRYVNLATGEVSRPETNIVEVGTYIAEFGVLSEWTGDRRYYDLAKRAMRVVHDKRTELGLLPHDIHAETGEWRNRQATVGPPGDSYYEYLWDGYALFGDEDLRRWYDTLTDAILAHQAERRDGLLWFPQVDAFTGEVLSREQSVLAGFYAGLLAESGRIGEGRAYHDAFNTAQEKFGVLPNSLDYATMSAADPGNALRPEFADAALMLWLATGDEIFRERAKTHYDNMLRTSKTNYGFAGLTDVTAKPPSQEDSCPGYWWSEQMKYYWLLFSDTPRFDYRDNYLSTEANLLRGARR
ncbi:mannosyl-oligosaccharide alpha-1,2-mannosidase [Saccharopolyspora antimicrobica]|uniref:Mannosyl-oligosaccharide alpha-1,2-mannosidase n=1 Tax=Saccharopolyspora antimicrobica TaxID=455193 RepID=A0A1I4TGD4_9PSEU|nr:glycoside hydrolase family 47 protein [Saccharopolyspora antimicrobica]RKT85733.1 mannosyl-oligosaccharide alpha-1,2-mannosidase [Saccharopolyspora antimicrobica]SFM75617.1 mannosyl-oligosaccharide alpha-1,2-mannosidase [Saccharopolyspora antimicrobica]